jgi:flagellar assembly protein FliH
MAGNFERVAADARIVGLGDLLRPRDVPASSGEAAVAVAPPPDPRVLLEQERTRVLEAARKDGHAAGMRDAEQDIETRARAAEREWQSKYQQETERLADATRRLQNLIQALPKALTEIQGQVEALTIEATYAATARVVAEAARDETMVIAFCREALAEYALRPAVLRVHPDALAAVKSALADDDIRLESDARLAAGQCRIESAKGLYDISLAHRLEALKTQLLASLQDVAAEARESRA